MGRPPDMAGGGTACESCLLWQVGAFIGRQEADGGADQAEDLLSAMGAVRDPSSHGSTSPLV